MAANMVFEGFGIMGLLSFFGTMSSAHISWVTLVSGAKCVGADPAGNKYYSAKPRRGYKRDRRWVIYNGVPEASNVPPEWHGWLHHQNDTIPTETGVEYRRPWMKPHRPNLTGTTGAYLPPGHLLAGGVREKATGDYEPWSPPDQAE